MQWSGSPRPSHLGHFTLAGASADLSTARMDLQPRSRSCRQGGPAHGEVSLPAPRSYGSMAQHLGALVPLTLGKTQVRTTGPGWGLVPCMKRPLTGCACPLSAEGPWGHRCVLLVWAHEGTGLADGAVLAPHRERTAASARRIWGLAGGRATGASCKLLVHKRCYVLVHDLQQAYGEWTPRPAGCSPPAAPGDPWPLPAQLGC